MLQDRKVLLDAFIKKALKFGMENRNQCLFEYYPCEDYDIKEYVVCFYVIPSSVIHIIANTEELCYVRGSILSYGLTKSLHDYPPNRRHTKTRELHDKYVFYAKDFLNE